MAAAPRRLPVDGGSGPLGPPVPADDSLIPRAANDENSCTVWLGGVGLRVCQLSTPDQPPRAVVGADGSIVVYVAAMATGYEFGINLLRSTELIERGSAVQADIYSAASSVGVRTSKRVWLGRWIRRTGGLGRTIDTPSPRSTQPKKKFCIVPTDTHAAASAGFSRGGGMSGVLIASFSIEPPAPEPLSADVAIDDAVSDSGSEDDGVPSAYRDSAFGEQAMPLDSIRRSGPRAPAVAKSNQRSRKAAAPLKGLFSMPASSTASAVASASPAARPSASRSSRTRRGPRPTDPTPALPVNGPREAAIGLGRDSGTTYNKAASISVVERVVEISVRFVVEGETTDDHHGIPRVIPTPAVPTVAGMSGLFGEEPVGGAPVGGAPVGGAPVGGAPVGGAPVGGAPVVGRVRVQPSRIPPSTGIRVAAAKASAVMRDGSV